ncbi:metal ABC transporter permease [Pauljensenia sp. UMB0018B]|uniref:High-affinity zinc uptake system membrane protein ZnuB n=1 Tax=Schaalia odontolytica TaxID=1660 RepID=A0A2I1I1E2_9ACTO|nr:metal ABC transporter permease [Schaalia odontolytica]MDK7340530.1 metal ABC transporter permease [Pauljensenia sp. UMB0018B]PKY64919.1 zinc ABC transporter permease [Schaalia odontolytica]
MIAPYLLRPVIVLGLLALAVGPASTLVNLRRAEFSAETMVHGVFPGIVVGMAIGGRDAIIPGGAVCAALIAAALTVASRKQRHSEATTAVLLTAFFSLGIVISLRIGDMSGQLESLMFGRLLDITPSRMATSALVLVVAAALLALTWRAQVAVAFDREATRVSGIPVTWIDIAFNAALGAIVVAASTAVGVLLVVGYLVVPGAFGRLLASCPRAMVLLAGACALVGGWAGFGVSLLRAPRPLSPQACVAMGVLVCFAVACAIREIRARRAPTVTAAREKSRETTVNVEGGEAS